jgi:hypothetical protein
MSQPTFERRPEDPLLKNNFCDLVLNWVLKMQIGPTRFKMSENSDGTIFTSCFALFLFDLFGVVDTWTERERDLWVDYLCSYQDKKSGYFIPDSFDGDLNTKPVQQLTCFCLSALNILGTTPKYRFSFLKQWPRPEDVCNYLRETGCFSGRPTTGNMGMFLAIFLTYEYEKYKDETALDRLRLWFCEHEKTQNKSTGFWGNSLRNRYYAGFQNAFHQYVVYNYWNRPVPCYMEIVDNVLSIQDFDGHFAPIPGGGGCWDYDAADILINCGYKRGYRIKDVESALSRLFTAILKNQNNDGGFCESRKRPLSIVHVLNNRKFIYSGYNSYLWYYRLKATTVASRRKSRIIETHWTRKGRIWDQSDLWDTWFRCLALAEISETIQLSLNMEVQWGFHKHIGLGYFREANCCQYETTLSS